MTYTTTLAAPIKTIYATYQKTNPSPLLCAYPLSVGLFFDGTGNNEKRDLEDLKHSNIARLFQAYPNKHEADAYAYYMPGVGTPFEEIGEHDVSLMGGAFGVGGDARMLYAMLQVLNALHRYAYKDDVYFDEDQLLALCRNGNLLRNHHTGLPEAPHPEDAKALDALGERHGLRGGEQARTAFFLRHANALQHKLAVPRLPGLRPCELFLDVFGFSRGASQARVFCNWMERILTDGKLAGIPVRVRFLGLFDTVASVGLWDGVLGGMLGYTKGHGDWATEADLKVSHAVERCAHFIAMHEFRKNFPLDTLLAHEGALPTGWVEHIYPGAHSDIGGGYRPGGMGVAKGNTKEHGDSLKLSQIPLNHMYDCAKAARVPLDKTEAKQKDTKYDPFAIDPQLQRDYDRFIERHGTGAKLVHEWALPYLTWRWQQRERYRDLMQVCRAKEDEWQEWQQMIDANKRLISDAEALQAIQHRWAHTTAQEKHVATLDKEAASVLQAARDSAPLPLGLAEFFDNHVHDSYAGFLMGKLGHEPTGYWRYRKGFKGTAEATIVQTDALPNAKVA